MIPLSKAGLFWDNKILDWELHRYSDKKPDDFIEIIANKFNQSLVSRRALAIEFLIHKLKGKNVIELGCGSGLLAEKLHSLCGMKSYTGYDISPKAIDKANKKFDYIDNVSFGCCDLTEPLSSEVLSNIGSCDYVVSLGFLDWLRLDEINNIGEIFKDSLCFHSFSEKRCSLNQYIHSKYVNIKYGNKNNGYVPNYYSEEDIRKSFNFSKDKYSICRDVRMKFSTFIFT